MSISKDGSELYVNMRQSDVQTVDRAFDAAFASLRESGVIVEGDDRAENLVGAIARYVEECRT